jgi:3-isopropylmalate dehydrogenase
MILSVAMMMRYSLCHPDIATAIEKAVEDSIENGVRTKDIGGSYSTTQAGDAIAETLAKILKNS